MASVKKVEVIPTYMFPLKVPWNNKLYFNFVLYMEQTMYKLGLKRLATQLFVGIEK